MENERKKGSERGSILPKCNVGNINPILKSQSFYPISRNTAM